MKISKYIAKRGKKRKGEKEKKRKGELSFTVVYTFDNTYSTLSTPFLFFLLLFSSVG
jgi:hypothetical protein